MYRWKIWVEAARPKTLAAAFIPVLTGASIAWKEDLFSGMATLAALFCALTIQIGTNFANDYFDFVKGADTAERIGFQRATAAGLIPAKTMLTATILAFTIAFTAGLYLVWIGGWVVFWIGASSILFGVLYTGGPYPLGYNGLGDLFVFLFFGIVAVTGTYYVNALEWSAETIPASLAAGALCVNILVVNNLRDIDQDRIAGKRTLGVLFGEQVLKSEYLAMNLLAFGTLPWMMARYDYSGAILLPLLSLPFVLRLTHQVWFHTDKRSLNLTLERTAQSMILFGTLLSIGILLQNS